MATPAISKIKLSAGVRVPGDFSDVRFNLLRRNEQRRGQEDGDSCKTF
jgi:hypothetical protein